MEEPVFAENPAVHFEIASLAAESMRQFYTDLFGWELVTDEEFDYSAVFAGGGVGIDGGIAQLPPDVQMWPYVTLYVAVPDLAATYARAVELGGTGMMEPDLVVEGVEIAVFLDPAGYPMGIIKAWEPEMDEAVEGVEEAIE